MPQLKDSLATYDGQYTGVNYFEKIGLICGSAPLAAVIDGHTGKVAIPSSITTVLNTAGTWSFVLFIKVAANYKHSTEDMVLVDVGLSKLYIKGTTGSLFTNINGTHTDLGYRIDDGYSHFIGFSHDGTDISIYVDDSAESSTTVSPAISAGDIIINDKFIGKMDNLLVFDKALTPAEMSLLSTIVCNPGVYIPPAPPAGDCTYYDNGCSNAGIGFIDLCENFSCEPIPNKVITCFQDDGVQAWTTPPYWKSVGDDTVFGLRYDEGLNPQGLTTLVEDEVQAIYAVHGDDESIPSADYGGGSTVSVNILPNPDGIDNTGDGFQYLTTIIFGSDSPDLDSGTKSIIGDVYYLHEVQGVRTYDIRVYTVTWPGTKVFKGSYQTTHTNADEDYERGIYLRYEFIGTELNINYYVFYEGACTQGEFGGWDDVELSISTLPYEYYGFMNIPDNHDDHAGNNHEYVIQGSGHYWIY